MLTGACYVNSRTPLRGVCIMGTKGCSAFHIGTTRDIADAVLKDRDGTIVHRTKVIRGTLRISHHAVLFELERYPSNHDNPSKRDCPKYDATPLVFVQLPQDGRPRAPFAQREEEADMPEWSKLG